MAELATPEELWTAGQYILAPRIRKHSKEKIEPVVRQPFLPLKLVTMANQTTSVTSQSTIFSRDIGTRCGQILTARELLESAEPSL